MGTVGIISAIKSRVIPDESKNRRVLFGPFKGQQFDINLRHQLQLYLGLYERETYAAIRHASRTAQWLVDVGAGHGELCIVFALRPNVRRIIAIDGGELSTGALRAHLDRNCIPKGRVEVLTQYVGRNADCLTQHVGTTADWVALDSLALDRHARGFIKIDVDGAELHVLQSGDGLLSGGNVEILVETHSIELERDCIQWLQERQYSCRIIQNAWWRSILPEQRPIDHNRWLLARRSPI
jgi:FkbM family methyltransferase